MALIQSLKQLKGYNSRKFLRKFSEKKLYCSAVLMHGRFEVCFNKLID